MPSPRAASAAVVTPAIPGIAVHAPFTARATCSTRDASTQPTAALVLEAAASSGSPANAAGTSGAIGCQASPGASARSCTLDPNTAAIGAAPAVGEARAIAAPVPGGG